MGIPQFHNEGPDQSGGSASLTVNFTGFTWSANDIIEIIIATDGWVPVLTTANGFALAADPQGNTASQTTNGGVAGTADCGIFVFWKRAVGSTTATDPEPLFQAPSVQSGTSWCLQPNSFSGARTIGTPYHVITKSIVSTATTAVTSTAASSTLANCLFMPRVASSNDDSAFNNWTMTGSAGPSGTGAPNTGWHTSTGNAFSFTGDEGGFAAATSNVTGTTTFATSTKQALVTLVMASVNEFELEEFSAPVFTTPAPVVPSSWRFGEDDLPSSPVMVLDDDVALVRWPAAQVGGAAWLPAGDEMPGSVAGAVMDEDGAIVWPVIGAPPAVRGMLGDDDLPSSAIAALVDDAGLLVPVGLLPSPPRQVPLGDDEIGTASGASVVDDSIALPLPTVAAVVPIFVLPASDDYATPAAASLGATAHREKANTTSPTTGTLTTLTVYPAWTPSTAYSIVTDPRVANAGNSYECANNTNPGTSASSGG